ncbi:4-diphosphocytidyl-2-C-methyl-D-erythritol kinase [Tangfeifania diversioriginum]|uniref:4-diphosphocytidyl-2-C-methyl-D-erythritol kinase n=1 Tax=Tangfeifania diversioriginum TaxID=1168035 RepID=A0A1M6ME66_9BACT|nr:4-(cytidine 5'-diphospho)-2-C-methyl-D-erythritol kinase [Tangfeifania diversioriginum]SHJ81656.1 4-diphosphocytidyl-2-C-methyl-D-erythritol kinase [Tangfeifania diversioriginum]
MIVFPNAKINIGLHVVAKRPDGYHNLETVFYPVQLSDALEMAESRETKLTTSGIEVDGPPEKNLVLKAWQLLSRDFDLPPVHFHLHKNIPFGAGLGGGSADAAFTLKMLNDFFSLQIGPGELKKYASTLGADCPFFIENKSAFATGIGNELSPVDIDLSEFQVVILKPGFSVSTQEAYGNIVPAHPEFNLAELAKLPVERWKETVINDFEKSVFPAYPEIKKCREILYQQGANYASMTGSGSAVFGLFRHLPADFDNFIPRGIYIYR